MDAKIVCYFGDMNGDVFGMLHNKAVDLDCKINHTISKLEKKG